MDTMATMDKETEGARLTPERVWKTIRANQSMDATLLSTAVAHGCRLVTFVAGIPLTSVTGAKKEHLVVLGP